MIKIDLSSRAALVTGGTSGIGLATAGRLLDAGAAVAICGRNPERLAQAEAHLRERHPQARLIAAQCNVLVESDVAALAARIRDGEVDIAHCVCTSMFPSRRNGAPIPEMDAFRWVAPLEVAQYASGSLTRLFETALSLDELHRTL